MREILFRGRRIDNSEWVEGFYSYCTDGDKLSHRIYISFAETYGEKILRPMWFEIDPATVGQYTGLTDKSGKKIFEGDILGGQIELVTMRGNLTGQYVEARHVAEWNAKEAKFVAWQTYESRNPRYYAERKILGDLKIVAKYYPIIGNIHDKEAQHE